MESVIPIDVLDDLCSRFIINVPAEERTDVIRICFQIELAHWFYIDFYVKQKGNNKICNLKEFATHVFKHVPSLHHLAEKVDEVIGEWKEYKFCVPTYGAILLNEDLSHALLVQSYCSKSSWGFPKGKINKGESPWQCAIREVLEETGFDIREYMDPTEFIEAGINDQRVRLYIVPGISMDQQFAPKTRKEIKSVRWFSLADLPASKKEATTKLKTISLYMVTPFVRKLREWIYENYGGIPKKAKSKRPRNKSCGDLDYFGLKNDINPTPDKKKSGKKATVEKDLSENLDEACQASGSGLVIQQVKQRGRSESQSGASTSNAGSEAQNKVRRTLEYVMCQNPNIASPVAQSDEHTPNKKTPKKIRILKKSDSKTSSKDLLTSLFSNKELVSVDPTSSNVKSLPSSDSSKSKTPKTKDAGKDPNRDKLSESPQSKSFGNIQHDRVLSSFARVSHKGGGRNYFTCNSPAFDAQKPLKKSTETDSEVSNNPKLLEFTEIPFSKSFSKHGVKAWSNFKFDRQDLTKRLNG